MGVVVEFLVEGYGCCVYEVCVIGFDCVFL